MTWWKGWIAGCLAIACAAQGAMAADASPVNQVFQFAQSGDCSAWSDHSTTHATAYLWIPPECERVRGLVVMCTNVPEQRLVGSEALREICRRHDLGIVWCVPSFMNFKLKTEQATTVGFLQQLLNGLATQSGYHEVASAPVLPVGESGHLLMVDALVEQWPERCIAGIWLKNPHLPPHNRTVPGLVVFGTAQEWGQVKADYFNRWRDTSHYDTILRERHDHPDWPLSYVIDGSSGHFDVDAALTQYVSDYIGAMCELRLPHTSGAALLPLDMARGYVAGLPVPGHPASSPIPFTSATGQQREEPWYPSVSAAKEAQAYASIDWKADSPLPAMLGVDQKPLPFDFNGIEVVHTRAFESDGITFSLQSVLLDQLPATFQQAGHPLPTPPGPVRIEWLCGPIKPLGQGRFQIALDRSWPSAACYVAMRHPATPGTRAVVQPCAIDLKGMRNTQGEVQTLTFTRPADMPIGSAPQRLSAQSSAGLPVQFYVESGPAIIEDGNVVLTRIPKRTPLPVAVTIGASQWGSAQSPKVRAAPVVKQTFQIVPPQ